MTAVATLGGLSAEKAGLGKSDIGLELCAEFKIRTHRKATYQEDRGTTITGEKTVCTSLKNISMSHFEVM